MKRTTIGICCVLVAAMFSWASMAAASERADAPVIQSLQAQPYIVVYKTDPRAHPSWRLNVTAVTSRLERSYDFRSRYRYRHALAGFAGDLTRRQVARLRGDSRVALVSPDRVVHALARVPLAPGEAVPTGIGRTEAANAGGIHQASTAAVAVIDTGVDLSHPDLNVSAGRNCISGGSPSDDNGHGTLVSGIVAARNNGSGIVGVAPGTKIYAVKSLDSQGGGFLSEVICGIDWVTANASALNIKVANLSLGVTAYSSGCLTDPLHQAICNSTAAGVSYTVAAGNDASNFGGFPPDVPAAFPEVLAVTAASDSDGRPGGLGPALNCDPQLSDLDDRYASFSDYAVSQNDADHVVAAPGTCITSTAMGGGLATESGTSFAAPHVAGVVALCVGEEGGVPGPCSGMSTAEVIQQIRADAAFNATVSNGFAGDPNHPLGPYYGFMLSALDPSIRRIPFPKGPGPPAPGPPAADKRVDWRKFRLRNLQDVDRLRVDVTLGEAGTVTVRATVPVSAARTAVRLKFKTVSRKAKANRRVVLRPRLSRRSLRKVKRSLRRGKRLQARLVVTARDGAKNSTSKRRNVRLRR